jgi:arsenate reductase-like glutaredoxin family protein
MAWMDYDLMDELLEHPELLRLPIVRGDKGVAIRPDIAALSSLCHS